MCQSTQTIKTHGGVALTMWGEKKDDCVPTPPLEQPTDDNMLYPKHRDEQDVEAHVYAFVQTWEANQSRNS